MVDPMPFGFDDIQHKVTFEGQSFELQPLSYKLMKVLAEAGGKPVGTDRLLSAVWGETSVSPEALKQRIFLLRKAIEEAGWQDVEVSAVRGQGYRLLVNRRSGASTSNPVPTGRNKLAFVLGLVIAVLLVAYLALREPPPVPVSNRVVLWRSDQPFVQQDATLYQAWREHLLDASVSGQLQVIQSKRDHQVPIPVQARQSRVALISFFETLPSGNDAQVRLSIIEPTTATILRSELLSSGDPVQLLKQFESHIRGMERLVSSGKLALNKAQKDNAKHPVWAELRAIAQEAD